MIGVDLVYLPEFQARLESGGNMLLEKMFTLDEIKDRRTEHLAGIWAAKEAVRKTMSAAPEAWTDIYLMYEPSGKPSAMCGNVRYDISISHQGDYAVAIAQEIPGVRP